MHTLPRAKYSALETLATNVGGICESLNLFAISGVTAVVQVLLVQKAKNSRESTSGMFTPSHGIYSTLNMLMAVYDLSDI